MIMKRLLSILLLILIVIGPCAKPVYAKKGEEHKKDYRDVIFGTSKLSDIEKAVADAFAAAAFLTIDQYKNTGQNQLDVLKTYGIQNLPTIEEISIEGKGKHRTYAHNGWDSEIHPLKYRNTYNDSQWDKKWKLRKGIIEKTVNKTFDFNWWSGIPIIGNKLPTSSEECDSFCALIYYIHLIGDHVETHTLDEYKCLMPLGGRFITETIVSELEYHCEVLFAEQTDTLVYSQLQKSLRKIDNDCLKLGIISEDTIDKNHEIANELLDELKRYIPKLLKEEAFFTNAMKANKKAS